MLLEHIPRGVRTLFLLSFTRELIKNSNPVTVCDTFNKFIENPETFFSEKESITESEDVKKPERKFKKRGLRELPIRNLSRKRAPAMSQQTPTQPTNNYPQGPPIQNTSRRPIPANKSRPSANNLPPLPLKRIPENFIKGGSTTPNTPSNTNPTNATQKTSSSPTTSTQASPQKTTEESPGIQSGKNKEQSENNNEARKKLPSIDKETQDSSEEETPEEVPELPQERSEQ